tara:strand:+ start:550 stop:729 length:180 start_codon:yes stop_codon:yes gene_type:complete
MKNLEEMWNKIGSVTKDEVVTAVLKDEIELYKSRIEPSGTGYLYDAIAQLQRRIEEINK